MKQENMNYPPLNDLEGMTVDELFALRQKCREVRDNIFHRTNEESDNIQAKLRREYHSATILICSSTNFADS